MNVKQIRKLNLGALVAREKTAAALAEKVGTDAAYLSHILGKKGKAQVGDAKEKDKDERRMCRSHRR